jgi:hypothetical protein
MQFYQWQMCKTYNQIGSLTTLKIHLGRNGIHDFKSVKEIIDFQNSYAFYRQRIISLHEELIEQEKGRLKSDLQELDQEIVIQKQELEQKLADETEKRNQQLNLLASIVPANFFQKITRSLRQWFCKLNFKQKEKRIGFESNRFIGKLQELRETKESRLNFIVSKFDDAVIQSSRIELSGIERKKSVVDSLSSFIYGALGEQKVVNTLEALSDEYFLINDLAVSFSPAIYNRQENDYIKSIQIDHILVAPSGIFVIETKNWSEESLENLSLRSPVKQVRRTSFALFKLLNNEMSNHYLGLEKHQWGNKKISVKNLIVFTGTKPKEEFQHVKILTLSELLSYIKYFEPIFSGHEARNIADFLLSINEQKVFRSR